MTTTERLTLKMFALMVAGLAVTYVPGDNYTALRALGYVALYGAWFWFVRQDYHRGREWLRTHKAREAIPRALELASYWLPLLFILTRDLAWWVKAAWCVGWIVVWVAAAAGAAVARAYLRETRRA